MKKLTILLTMTILVLAGCSKSTTSETKSAVSDGSKDLVIDALVNLDGNESMNYFNWSGNIRYMAVEDSYDLLVEHL